MINADISFEPGGDTHDSVRLQISRYPNGQKRVRVHDCYGEPIAELSLMSDDIDLAKDEVILKEDSENAGLIEDFMLSNLFTPTNRFVLIGAHLCPICQIYSGG